MTTNVIIVLIAALAISAGAFGWRDYWSAKVDMKALDKAPDDQVAAVTRWITKSRKWSWRWLRRRRRRRLPP